MVIALLALNPIENPGVDFVRCLPEITVRLTAEHFVFGFGDALGEHLRLRDMIAADDIGAPGHHEGGNAHLAEMVGGFPVVACHTQPQVIVETRVCGPR